MQIRLLFTAIMMCLVSAISGCDQSGSTVQGEKKVRVAFVSNGIAPFWVIAEKGARAGAKDFNADVDVRLPSEGVSDQKRILQELLTRNVDGIAISPIDPDNQLDLLNEAAARTKLITQDSDAPSSNRLCYIGVDNYAAGRLCGQLVKQAMPDGGSVMIFVGRLEQMNAKLRRQGVIDELLDRSHDPSRLDPTGQEIRGEKYVILDTRTDQFDFSRAKQLAEEAIAKVPDLGCMVGLYAYNPPLCLEAIKAAGKTGKIKLIGFDEDDATLQGIIDGHIQGTVVQDPYKYGYESVRILASLARGDHSVIPESKFVNIPARQVTQENVQAFWDELKELTGVAK